MRRGVLLDLVLTNKEGLGTRSLGEHGKVDMNLRKTFLAVRMTALWLAAEHSLLSDTAGWHSEHPGSHCA